jgi:DNA-binding CsgD family transcriptional regulator
VRAAVLYERLGEYHYWDDAAALECYERALALLPAGAAPERARVMAAQGHALMGMRRWLAARERCEAGLAVGDPQAEPGARITLGLVLGFLGEPTEGEAQLRRALDLAAALGAGEDTARAHIHLAELLRLRGQREEALAVAAAGEDAAARFGMRGSFGHFMYVNAAEDLLRLGRWDEAERRLAGAERRDLGRTAATMCHTLAGELRALRGDAEAARAQLELADELAAAGLPGEFMAPIRGAWATLALTEGDATAARDHVAAALEVAQDALYTPPLLSLAVRVEADLCERARAARSDHDRGRADALLAALDALLTVEGWAPPHALAHRALAQAEGSRAAGAHAVEPWASAVDAFERLAEPHPAAYARLRQAEAALVSAHDRALAGRLLVQAWATAVALRAAPLRDEIEALARRARLELAPPAAPDAPAPEAGPLGLTARETEVLRLLAEGLTNREIAGRLFISQKTVAAHVAHIFDKLDVHTRVEAAGRAQRLGMLDPSS